MPLVTWRWGDPVAVLAAARARGAVLVVPTESSYGLGVDPGNRRAVEAVYRLKAREAGKPLPVVIAEPAQAAALGVDPGLPELARAARCWPGPLTAVLPLRPGTGLPAAAGTGSVAVRVPAHDRLRRLLRELGPLTATSANPAGGAPLVDPAEVAELAAGADAVLVDDGVLPGGPPSTVVAFDAAGRPRVLRAGRLSPADLAACLGG
jgi:L-threonylcarbamoyladenylate synthase